MKPSPSSLRKHKQHHAFIESQMGRTRQGGYANSEIGGTQWLRITGKHADYEDENPIYEYELVSYDASAEEWTPDIVGGLSGVGIPVNRETELDEDEEAVYPIMGFVYVENDDDRALFMVGGGKPAGMFPVKVSKDGGQDGNLHSAATWTYTVNSLENEEEEDEPLGTNVPQEKPRPLGGMVFQTDGYGVAFYEGEDLRLWDAGEVPRIEVCPEEEDD